ncbi:oxygenase MpaB family protein [Saccharothrix coeruleofusca]|uniref:Peptidase n=1 Tax=Saccharothrix coeruleofusca TaxID=33919 RepID=A0A918EBH3_9PSEU|nr:oxygenase MpaB family protein [Saccharothrix coeruleofusca]GGP42093.1 peptidase [Saccharothrix coeruleofusca]
MADRFANVRRITALDPERDAQEILRISTAYEFPWDYLRALEFALFRTYCVPSVSALLAATGEFERRPQKRYDDTALLMAELVDHGYDSARGKEALRVINRLHGRYDIAAADMRYVLSTFIYDPIEWISAYGWRDLTDHERQAAFHFYRAVGARMGIRGIPDSYEAFLAFKRDYEAEHFTYADSNRQIGQYTLDLFCSWYPAWTRPAVSLAVRSLLEPPMLAAVGFTPPPRWIGALTRLGLRIRARVVRHLPPREVPRLTNDPGNRTYPGYPGSLSPSDLGAP